MTKRTRGPLIVFERATVTQDSYGEEVLTWPGTTLASERAQVFYGRGDERRQAAMEEGEQPATFRVNGNSVTRSITLKDRISFDGSYWDIESKALDVPDRRHVEFTATRAQ